MKEIRWSVNSETTFDAIYQFVLEQWGIDISEQLRHEVLKTLHQISKHPYSFQESQIANVRRAIISKHTSIFYEVFNDYILLVFFWDNRQKPIF